MKRQRRWSPAIPLLFRLCLAVLVPLPLATVAVEILSKSKLERCVQASGSDSVDCEKKIVLNMAVPSGSVNATFPFSLPLSSVKLCAKCDLGCLAYSRAEGRLQSLQNWWRWRRMIHNTCRPLGRHRLSRSRSRLHMQFMN